MAYPIMPVAFAGSTPAFGVSRSLRFNGANTHLQKRINYEGNTRTFTQSMWVKRGTLGVAQWVGLALETTDFAGGLYFGPDDKLYAFIHYNVKTGLWEGYLITQQVFRDAHAWYHITLAVDTTQVVASNRIKLFVNGAQVIAFDAANTSTPTYPVQHQQTVFNTNLSTAVSAANYATAYPQFTYIGMTRLQYYADAIVSELHWVDGAALAPQSFGKYDQNGAWVPRAYTGNHGPNGFYLPFNNNGTRSTLGMNMQDAPGMDAFQSFNTFHLQTRTNATATNNHTFIDSSATAATITRTGTVFQGTFNPFSSTYAPLCSCSAYFDGNSELNAGSNASFAFGTGSYTVEFWVYQASESYPATTGPVFVAADTTGGWLIWNQIGPATNAGLKISARNGTDKVVTNTLLPINRWNHVAVCRGSGNSTAMWLNGTRIAVTSDSTDYTIQGPLKIGGISTNGHYAKGWMSDVHILKNVSKYDVSASTIDVPVGPMVNTASSTLLCNFSNAAIYDATCLNNVDTRGNARSDAASPVYGTSSLLLDTDGDALSGTIVNSVPNFKFDTEDFTIEAWIKLSVMPTAPAAAYIASVHDNNVNNSTWVLYAQDNRLSIYGAGGLNHSSTNSIYTNTWMHVAAVRQADNVTLYINGETGGTLRVTGLNYINTTAALTMGRRLQDGGNTGQFKGNISDLRITRAARYLSNFTPPAAALPTTGRKNNWIPINFNISNSTVQSSMQDSPVNMSTNQLGALSGNTSGNFCTLSPLQKAPLMVLSHGNLNASTGNNSLWRAANGTTFLSAGKWYWEVQCTGGTAANHVMIGIARSDWANVTSDNTFPGDNGETWAYYGVGGNYYRNGGGNAFGAATFGGTDVIGCALDMDNGYYYVSKNGAWQGTVAANPSIGRAPLNPTALAPGAWAPSMGVYNNATTNTGSVACNFGQRPFLYANAPQLSAGFKPICTANAVIPTIKNARSFFTAIAYAGGTNTYNADAYAGNCVLALPLDSYNTFYDASSIINNFCTQPKAIYTMDASVTFSSISGAYFNGTTGYIELTAHPDFDLGGPTVVVSPGSNSNWTMEWYQYWNSLAGFQTLWNNNYTTNPGGNLLIQTGAGDGRYRMFTNGGTAIFAEATGATAGLWHHHALVKNNNTYTFFRNGSATGTVTYTAVTNAGSTTFRPEIGRGSGQYFLNGNIRDFRIYKGIAKYVANFNPITLLSDTSAASPLLFATGRNNVGQLGLGNATNTNVFSAVAGNWSSIAAGTSQTWHTMALSAGTTTWYGVGDNFYGQLGLSNKTNVVTFSAVSGNWSRMVCGDYHTMALSAGTTTWFGAGYNFYGQLGLSNKTNVVTFSAIPGNWSAMVCGAYHTMALSAGTNAWFGTGWNNAGQLGLGNTTEVVTFSAVPGNWSRMVCGDYRTMAQSAGTTTWFGAGSNPYGQLGLSNTTNTNVFSAIPGNWSAMTCGSLHTMAQSAGTTTWFGAGYNIQGQLGLSNVTSVNAFSAIEGNWSRMACGAFHTMALSAGTNAWFGAGGNFYGQLGLSNTTNTNVFSAIPGNWHQMTAIGERTMALSAGRGYSTALAISAIVALTGTGFNKNINTSFQPDLVWIKARNIGRTSHVLMDSTRNNTSVLCANSTAFSNSDTRSSDMIAFNNNGFSVGAGLYQWYGVGVNTSGQLGLGTTTNVSVFTSLTGNWSNMVCGRRHTVAQSADTGAWLGTGRNTDGQLGLGHNISNVTALSAIAGNWSQITCGQDHTMALSAGTNTWYAAGKNNKGQLGLSNVTSVNAFSAIEGNWSAMACGATYTVAQSAGTNTWFGTGDNSAGSLGLSNNTDVVTFSAIEGNWSRMVCGTDHTMALSAGTFTWFGAGKNSNGQLGVNDNASKNAFTIIAGNWSRMVCGSFHTMALSAGTNAWFGTGRNTEGQLGLGDILDKKVFTRIAGNWSQMTCGSFGTLALALSTGTKPWFGTGYNVDGNLGTGDVISKNVFTAIANNWNNMAAGNFDTTLAGSINYTMAWAHGVTNRPQSLINTPGATYAAYAWKRNALAGFDIVNFNKLNATNESFAHALKKIPQMMIVKGVNVGTSWNVYHASLANAANAYVALESQAASTAAPTMWNNTAPTNSQFTLGTIWPAGNYVAYLFAEVPGFSRFGTYTGNTNLPFVWCGFKPRFVMTKRTDVTSDWLIWDSARSTINPISPHFTVNTNAQDNSLNSPTYTGYVDFVSTGFKWRFTTNSEPNVNGGAYIFAAFAEEPFGKTPSQTPAR